jgi:hypothetical protein
MEGESVSKQRENGGTRGPQWIFRALERAHRGGRRGRRKELAESRMERAHTIWILQPRFVAVTVMGMSRTSVFVLVLVHFTPAGR